MTGKQRSRSISSYDSLPTTRNTDFSKIQQFSLDSCLGEELRDELGTAVDSFSTNTSDLEDLGIRLSGLSSGSSLSWSEEYESEVSKKVQLELEKMDRIFQGLQNDTALYDRTEIAEWKHYFPNLYILGRKTPTNSPDLSDGSLPEEGQKQGCFQTQASSSRNGSCLVNEHDNISEDVSNRYCNSLPRKLKSVEIEHYLKISSFRNSALKQRTKNTQSSQVSKNLVGDVFPEFISLPFISTTVFKAHSPRKIYRHKPPNLIVLPPIDTAFRSISATPRKASSKSMYDRITSNKESKAAKLKTDLMTLFDNIPISNR